MHKIDWKPTVRGYKAIVLNGKYILEVWNSLQSGGWLSSVNGAFIFDDDTGKSIVFDSEDKAKKAAEQSLARML